MKNSKRAQVQRLRNSLSAGVWFITPDALDEARSIVLACEEAGVVLEEQLIGFGSRLSRQSEDGMQMVGATAIVNVTGMIRAQEDIWTMLGFGTSNQTVERQVRAALADERVGSVLLYVDSPGGQAQGNEEAAQAIYDLRGSKPIWAYTRGQMSSAAYYIASAADRVLVSPTAIGGSIGAILVHQQYLDPEVKSTVIRYGENKALGTPWEALSDKARAELQRTIDIFGKQFETSVARNRGVSLSEVQDRFGRGATFVGGELVTRGLADGVANSVEAVLGQLQSSARASASTSQSTGLAQAAGVSAARPLQETEKMNPKIKAALYARGLIAALDASDDVCRAALNAFCAGRSQAVPATDDAALAVLTGTERSEPATIAAAAAPVAQSAPNVVEAHRRELEEARAAARLEASTAERTRVADLRARASLLGVSQASLDAAIAAGTPVADAVNQWTNERIAANPPVAPRVEVTGDGQQAFARDAVDSLLVRLNMAPENCSAQARQWGRASVPLHYLAKRSLALCGQTVGDMDLSEDIGRRALEMEAGSGLRIVLDEGGPYNRPGAFPNILSSLANKVYDVGVQRANPTYPVWTGRLMDDLPDFKAVPMVARSSPYVMDEIVDADAYKEFALAEEILATIQVRRFGNSFGWTPAMVANDDMGAFAEAVLNMGMMSELTVNRLCLGVLTGNPYLLDSYQFIDGTNHGNAISGGSGGAPSTTQWKLMRDKVSAQTPVGGKGYIREQLSVALVPPQLEPAALQTFASFGAIPEVKVPVTDATLNVYRGTATVVSEPELQGTSTAAWYGFCNPQTAPSIVRAYFRGWGPGGRRVTWFDTATQTQWVAFECRVGVAPKQYRTVVYNPGS